MGPEEIAAVVKPARANGRTVIYDPVPDFAEGKEYVYEASIEETADGLVVHLAVGQVPPSDGNMDPFPMPEPPAPLEPTVEATAEDGTVV